MFLYRFEVVLRVNELETSVLDLIRAPHRLLGGILKLLKFAIFNGIPELSFYYQNLSGICSNIYHYNGFK